MILVFGKSGQVAIELARQGDVLCLGRADCDLSVAGTATAAIAAHQPAAVINAAAYTAVDQAETDAAAALQINGHAVAEMADACARWDIPFVHISTDYVFAGDGVRPWTPIDPTASLGAYGRTKLAGEGAVRASGVTHAILRTSWVSSAHGNNFLKTMLRLGDALTVVGDQIGGPTPAADIAAACLRIAAVLQTDPNTAGTYHFAGAPDVSWADFARTIFDQTGITCDVTDIPPSDYPAPATRPLNSRMDFSSTEHTFNIPRPDWRQGITDILGSGLITKR